MPSRSKRSRRVAGSKCNRLDPTSRAAAAAAESDGTWRGPPMKPQARTSGSTVMSKAPSLCRPMVRAASITRATSGSTGVAARAATRLTRATSLVVVQLLISESMRQNSAMARVATAAVRTESDVTTTMLA